MQIHVYILYRFDFIPTILFLAFAKYIKRVCVCVCVCEKIE